MEQKVEGVGVRDEVVRGRVEGEDGAVVDGVGGRGWGGGDGWRGVVGRSREGRRGGWRRPG